MEEILNEIVGKEFNYKGKNIKIKSWKKVTATYVIFTSAQTFNLYENEIDNFINELKPVVDKIKQYFESQKNVSIQVKKDELKPNKMTETDKNIVPIQGDNLKQILLDTITKVQQDKAYINQANAICNVVSQMINIKKLEIQLKNKV